MALIDQFRSGDCELVWRRIVDESRPASDPEASAVAHETVLRARDNLSKIYERLVEIGYDFEEPDEAFVTTTPEEAADEISSIEAEYGALPELARIWYSHIRSVNFAQTETQGRAPDHDLRNLGMCPLAIYLPLKRCRDLSIKIHADYTDWYRTTLAMTRDESIKDYLSKCKTPEEMAQFLPLGSIASNNENKGFALPCHLIDAEFFNDGEVTHFNEELRYVVLSGGFPILGSDFYREKVPEFMRLGHPDPDSLMAFLTHDLQAI